MPEKRRSPARKPRSRPRPSRRLSAPLRRRTPTQREEWAERIAARLDIPITALGIVAVLVLIADNSVPPGSGLHLAFSVAEIVFIAAFTLEFVLRVIIAPSTWTFPRRNWWQMIFIVLPFFRALRAFSRSARVARLASSSARAARPARARLGSRITWLATVTVTVILASSQLLFDYGPKTSYPEALHDTALATLGGEPINEHGFVPETLEILLIVYQIVIFAALAGALGAFFVEGRLNGGTAASARAAQ